MKAVPIKWDRGHALCPAVVIAIKIAMNREEKQFLIKSILDFNIFIVFYNVKRHCRQAAGSSKLKLKYVNVHTTIVTWQSGDCFVFTMIVTVKAPI